MKRPSTSPDLGLVLLSLLVLGQSALIILLVGRVRAAEASIDRFRTTISAQMARTDAFISFRSSGTWAHVAGSSGPALGDPDAQIEIVEFADLQCPACAAVAPGLIDYVETFPDRVRLTFKHFPLTDLHPQAYAAALAGVCADLQGRFWEYSKRVFEEQQELTAGGTGFLIRVADDLGIDPADFRECLESPTTRTVVENDLQLAGRLGLSGTPTFFVNRRRLDGGDLALLQAAIESEMAPDDGESSGR